MGSKTGVGNFDDQKESGLREEEIKKNIQ